MEAGYDYLLLRGRPQPNWFRSLGVFILLFGAVLLATSGAYFGYATNARADLKDLNAAVSDPYEGMGLFAPYHASESPDRVRGSTVLDEPGAGWLPFDVSGQRGNTSSPVPVARLIPGFSSSAIASHNLYPGESLPASFWSNPQAFEPLDYQLRVLLAGFTPIESAGTLLNEATPAATRIVVPSIGIDSNVVELGIKDLGGSRAYETPANAVGHIPETADAGEGRSAWFFGHTESPTLGEGSVFFNLGKIPERLRAGEDVYIITDNGHHQFLYRVVSTAVVHQNDMRLYDTGVASIHLVSCVPRLVYDHRLVVTGELIARKTL